MTGVKVFNDAPYRRRGSHGNTLVLNVFTQQSHGGIHLRSETGVHKAVGEQSTSLDVLLCRMGIAVDVRETFFGVPEKGQTQGRGGRKHAYQRNNLSVAALSEILRESLTVVLVLVDPTLTLLGADHKLLVGTPDIDERVDESTSQVLLSRVDIAATRGVVGSAGRVVVEVRLVHIFERHGRLEQVESLGKVLEVSREAGVVEDGKDLGVRLFELAELVCWEGDLVASKDEGKLLLHGSIADASVRSQDINLRLDILVGCRVKVINNELHVVELDSQSDGLGEARI